MARGRSAVPLALVALAAVLVIRTGLGFVSARASPDAAVRGVPLRAKKFDLFGNGGDSTKGLSEEIAEKNGENVQLVDTDDGVAVFFTIAGALLTYGFVQLLYSLKPPPSA